MKLQILGTGAAFATEYNHTSFILDNGQEYFLVDGMGGVAILKAFKDNHLQWQKLHNAYLSHQHTDHLLGMIWVIRYIADLMLKEKYQGDFTIYLHFELKEKVIKICQDVLKAKESALLENRIKFKVVKDQENCQILNLDFTFFDIHSTKAKQFGFKIQGLKHNLVFCGDEPINKLNEPYIKNADLLLLEAYCLEQDADYFHPHQMHHNTVMEAAKIAQRLKVKNLILYHTEDEKTFGHRKELYTKEAQQYYFNNLIIPEDYDVFNIDL